jgi:hypothetical protein
MLPEAEQELVASPVMISNETFSDTYSFNVEDWKLLDELGAIGNGFHDGIRCVDIPLVCDC